MDTFSWLDSLITAQASTKPRPSKILQSLGTPTTSIAVLDKGQISTHSISAINSANEDTVFQACSISKPVAGMAALRLVQASKLDLEASISSYLDESFMAILETETTKLLLPHITVKHLMSHTSGLSVHGFAGYTGRLPTLEAVLSGLAPVNSAQVRLESFPGQAYSYSGGGLSVLQLIMQKVTGQSFPSLMQDLVFEPLGMTRSFYGPPEPHGNFERAHYTGYTPCEVEYRLNPEQAAAGLWTTPTDLLKVVRALQQSLSSNSPDNFLQRSLAQQMLTEVMDDMALAWFAPKDPGISFFHSGSNGPGWECFVVGFADLDFDGHPRTAPTEIPEGCGISVMTNSAMGSTTYQKIVAALLYAKGWPGASVRSYFGVFCPFEVRAAMVGGKWRKWLGVWDGGWKIEEGEDGYAYVVFSNFPPTRLYLAAYPVERNGTDAEVINLIPEGLSIMLRLICEQGVAALEIWQEATGESFKFHKTTNEVK